MAPANDDYKWFFEKGMMISNNHEGPFSLLQYISPHHYRFYLSWILGSSTQYENADSLCLFRPEARNCLGTVLNSSSFTGSVSLMAVAGKNDELVKTYHIHI